MAESTFLCPECGADLSQQDVKAHALSHWNENIPDYPQYAEARKRQKVLYDEDKRRKLKAQREEN